MAKLPPSVRKFLANNLKKARAAKKAKAKQAESAVRSANKASVSDPQLKLDAIQKLLAQSQKKE